MITHRNSSLLSCNRILKLGNNGIDFDGPPDLLFKKIDELFMC